MEQSPLQLCGVINVDKPAGMSSARVVTQVKRSLPHKMKVGHAGTLDPFATGVLLVLVGKATKQCLALMGERKVYEATIKFGATTATDDVDSEETVTEGAVVVTRERVEEALRGFVGEIRQRPPAFSALKVGGKRAYELARKGKTVALEARVVSVHSIEVVEYEWPRVVVRVECGKGTYIRSIARDLGEALSVGGYLVALRRTRSGAYDVGDAVTLEELKNDGVEKHLRVVSRA
jgi:tRNA pseudouridine55 synthase